MRFRPSLVALLLVGSANVAAAQYEKKVQIIPEFGYTWGGSRSFDASTINGVLVPGGRFVLDDSPTYGVTVAFEGWTGNSFTMTYMRQDTKLGVDWNSAPPSSVVPNPGKKGGFATNQWIFGGKHEFAKTEGAPMLPYVGFGLGWNHMAPKFDNVGNVNVDAANNFLFSLHGGVKYMFGEEQRVGLLGDFRAAWTYVPSGDWATYCDYWYGCTTVQGTTALTQTTLKAGLVYKF